MKPRQFTLDNHIVLPFSVSKVNDIAGELRSRGLFPKGGKHDYDTQVSINQAALFLYLLASDTPVKQIKRSLETLTQLKNNQGLSFYEEFTSTLRNPERLKRVEAICIGEFGNFPIAEIRYEKRKDIFTESGEGRRPSITWYVRMGNEYLTEFCKHQYTDDLSLIQNIDIVEAWKTTPKDILENKPALKDLKYVINHWDE